VGVGHFLLSIPGQTGPGNHPASCTMGNGAVYSGIIRPGVAMRESTSRSTYLLPSVTPFACYGSTFTLKCLFGQHRVRQVTINTDLPRCDLRLQQFCVTESQIRTNAEQESCRNMSTALRRVKPQQCTSYTLRIRKHSLTQQIYIYRFPSYLFRLTFKPFYRDCLPLLFIFNIQFQCHNNFYIHYTSYNFILTPRSRDLTEKLTRPQLLNKFPAFKKPEGSLPRSQKATTCPYSQLDRSSQCPIPILEYAF
jgi:hypothetical protein